MPTLTIRCRAIDWRGRWRPGVGGQGVRSRHAQVDGAAFGVIRYARHIAQAPEVLLIHPWIEFGLKRIARLSGEAPHVRDRATGAIAIEHLQAIALRPQCRLYPGEGFGGILRQQALGRFITLERVPGEVVGAGITNVLFDTRIDRA
ncbi:hypothetical protein D3C76_1327580 [compost metagenome]